MTKDATAPGVNLLAVAAMLSAFAAFTAISFAAWMRYGPEIFLVLADNGINWCL